MKRYLFLFLLYGSLTTFLAYNITHAFFSNGSNSIDNTFTASANFPTDTPVPTIIIDITGVPTPTPTLQIIPTGTQVAVGDVVINEINWAGSNGDGNDEWIELRNTTSNSININGWVIENLGTGSGPGANITIASASAVIPANGYFLISANSKANSSINVEPDFITSAIALVNGGEQLTLKTSSSFTVDIANNTSAWFEGTNSTPKRSMERKTPPGNGTIAGNWQDATTHTNMDGSAITSEFATPKAENGL